MDPKLAIFTIPAMVIGLMLRTAGPASKFRRAGAVSPSTAIRSSDIGVERRFLLASDLASGLLVEAASGRYYVDDATWRRMRRRKIVLASVIGIAGCIGAGWWWSTR